MKRWMALLLAMLMAMSLVACGQKEQTDGGDDGQQVYTLRLNTNMSENDKTNSAFGVALTNFKAECEEKSGGRLIIDIYMNSQLGKSTDELINGSQSGAFEMFNLVAANWGSYTNAFAPINIPYLFTDEEVLQKYLRVSRATPSRRRCCRIPRAVSASMAIWASARSSTTSTPSLPRRI